MNEFPIIEMLAFYSRFSRAENPAWRGIYTKQLKKVRSCHSKSDGGVKQSFYTIETSSGDIIDLVFEEESLIWKLQSSDMYPNHVVDKVLALTRRHKHTPSKAHRIIPYRFEIIPKSKTGQNNGIEHPLINRVQPYRFRSGKLPSTQTLNIVTRHLENVMITKHLHYVVETDQHRFFHIVYVLDQSDWRLMNEVDEQFLFVR